MSIPFSCDLKRSYHASTKVYKPFEYLLRKKIAQEVLEELSISETRINEIVLLPSQNQMSPSPDITWFAPFFPQLC